MLLPSGLSRRRHQTRTRQLSPHADLQYRYDQANLLKILVEAFLPVQHGCNLLRQSEPDRAPQILTITRFNAANSCRNPISDLVLYPTRLSATTVARPFSSGYKCHLGHPINARDQLSNSTRTPITDLIHLHPVGNHKRTVGIMRPISPVCR